MIININTSANKTLARSRMTFHDLYGPSFEACKGLVTKYSSSIPQTESAKSASLSMTGQINHPIPVNSLVHVFSSFSSPAPSVDWAVASALCSGVSPTESSFCSSLCSDAYFANLSKADLLFCSQEPILLQLTSTNPPSVSSVAANQTFSLPLEVL